MELVKGRPADASGRTEKEIRVYDFLDSLGIEYFRVDHEPAGNNLDAAFFSELESTLGATICNNLFLANRQRTVFHMLMIPAHKRFRSGDVSKQAGCSRLHFAEPEYMEGMIGCAPGSASVMGLMNDTGHKVQLLVDEDILGYEWFGCHPCVNTSSLRIRTEDIFGKFLKATGHSYITIRAEE